MNDIQLFDTVALTIPVPVVRLKLFEPKYASISSLPIGLVGTVVEIYCQDSDRQYLVEFSDDRGQEYAMLVAKENELIALKYDLSVA